MKSFEGDDQDKMLQQILYKTKTADDMVLTYNIEYNLFEQNLIHFMDQDQEIKQKANDQIAKFRATKVL